MKDYSPEQLRNMAIIGHGSSGKTSLTAAMLFNTGVTTRLTRVDKGNTVTDYDPEEIERMISINSTPCFVEWKDHKINIIDTPGYSSFLWDTRASLRAVDSALLVVCGVAGVEVGTEKVWEMLEEVELPRLIVINKLDRENSSFKRTVDEIQQFFGRQAIPVQIPIGEEKNFSGVVDLLKQKAYVFERDESGHFKETDIPGSLQEEVKKRYTQLVETVAETDERLMENILSRVNCPRKSWFKA